MIYGLHPMRTLERAAGATLFGVTLAVSVVALAGFAVAGKLCEFYDRFTGATA